MKPVLLVGGGGHCRSVIAAARLSDLDLVGIIDHPELVGTKSLDIPVIATDPEIPQFTSSHQFIVTVGAIKSFALRQRLVSEIEAAGGSFATLIAPNASVDNSVVIGEGTVIMQFALVNACANVGKHCIINSGALIEHDATIGNFTHVSTNAVVNGGSQIGERCLVGSGAIITQGITICNDTIIGAGAVVTSDITEPGTYVGVPARKI